MKTNDFARQLLASRRCS